MKETILSTEIKIDTKDKPTSALIRHLIDEEKDTLSVSDVADALGISVQSLRNKLFRDSFSFKDLITICSCTNANISIETSKGGTIEIDPKDFLDADEMERLNECVNRSNEKTIERIKELSKSLSKEDIDKIVSEMQLQN